jgi:hypothetical protein
MDMPKPTEAHARLTVMAGRWTGQEHIRPSPWDPNGGSATGRSDNRVGLGGFVLFHDYEQERGGAVNFRGHGVLSYDAFQQCYRMHWWDSLGFPPNEYLGSFEGASLKMTARGSQGHSRVTWDFSQNDRYRFQMEVSQDGQQWQTFMDGDYTRQD